MDSPFSSGKLRTFQLFFSMIYRLIDRFQTRNNRVLKPDQFHIV